METTNVMGLDKFQLSIIKGNYGSLKPIIAKKNKLMAKIEAATEKEEKAIQALKEKTQESLKELYKEVSVYDEQINALDNITKTHTQRACGMELTSEQVMQFLSNPDEFEQYKSSVLGDDMFKEQESNVACAA